MGGLAGVGLGRGDGREGGLCEGSRGKMETRGPLNTGSCLLSDLMLCCGPAGSCWDISHPTALCRSPEGIGTQSPAAVNAACVVCPDHTLGAHSRWESSARAAQQQQHPSGTASARGGLQLAPAPSTQRCPSCAEDVWLVDVEGRWQISGLGGCRSAWGASAGLAPVPLV